MNKRIRYIKGSDPDIPGLMIGNKYYRNSQGTEYRASFMSSADGTKTLGVVASFPGYDQVFNLEASSPHKIKIAIKKCLEELGCEFEKESRGKDE